MVFGRSSSMTTLAQQVKHIRQLHIFLGSVFALSSTALVFTVILGSSLFTIGNAGNSKARETLTFTSINRSSPLPILMSHSSYKNVDIQVMGESISKDETNKSEVKDRSSTFSNNFIKKFAFSILPIENGIYISASWKILHPQSDFLYVICEASGVTPKLDDIEIYSVAGKNLKETSRTFDLTSDSKMLYLKVFLFEQGGDYKLIDTSPVVTPTN